MAPEKGDETETQRSLKARHLRSTRRSTQGVTTETLEEAKRLAKVEPEEKLADTTVSWRSRLKELEQENSEADKQLAKQSLPDDSSTSSMIETLKSQNARMKEENAALVRVISKLSDPG
ncbi:Protein phosphatase 1, regulatory subunit [Cichlidogyrus casuarinus]|uniref:Protein phosphatase 1, regulatory subunit n=1 Tax=Cichlidogyrus casuarinus TaxID=1844966 RepID=A0ABD2PWP5_9PLAT